MKIFIKKMGADLWVRLQSNYPFLLLLYRIICQPLKKPVGFFLLIEQLHFLLNQFFEIDVVKNNL